MTSANGNTLRRPYRLSDWTFILGLPTNARELTNAIAVGDFCLLEPPLLTIESYRTAFLADFDGFIRPLGRLGLRVACYPRCRDYVHLLRGIAPTVLFTHCSEEKRSLEFRDGMIPFVSIAGRLDANFAGYAEICACAPDNLQDLLKKKAPRCVVNVSNTKLSSKLWLAYYAVFLGAFSPGPTTIWDAKLLTRDWHDRIVAEARQDAAR
jgi:hypothetical protein